MFHLIDVIFVVIQIGTWKSKRDKHLIFNPSFLFDHFSDYVTLIVIMESNGSNIQLQREFLSGFLVGGGFGTIFNPCFPLVKYFTKASFCGHHKLSNFQTVPNGTPYEQKMAA